MRAQKERKKGRKEIKNTVCQYTIVVNEHDAL
jgi:hypothetical protein